MRTDLHSNDSGRLRDYLRRSFVCVHNIDRQVYSHGIIERNGPHLKGAYPELLAILTRKKEIRDCSMTKSGGQWNNLSSLGFLHITQHNL